MRLCLSLTQLEGRLRDGGSAEVPKKFWWQTSDAASLLLYEKVPIRVNNILFAINHRPEFLTSKQVSDDLLQHLVIVENNLPIFADIHSTPLRIFGAGEVRSDVAVRPAALVERGGIVNVENILVQAARLWTIVIQRLNNRITHLADWVVVVMLCACH